MYFFIFVNYFFKLIVNSNKLKKKGYYSIVINGSQYSEQLTWQAKGVKTTGQHLQKILESFLQQLLQNFNPKNIRSHKSLL